MDSQKKKEKKTNPATSTGSTCYTNIDQNCTKSSCFFCIIKEPNSSTRRERIKNLFKEMPLIDDDEVVLVVSGLWNIAMTQPDDPEFPSLGIFDCMVSLIYKGINDKAWLCRDQNVYIPYYAAHIIGSYTMKNVEFAEKGVASGVIPPLLDLMRGEMSWVEQRVAVRALGHLASYERTFEAVANHEEELVKSAMHLASTCLEVVYNMFVGEKNERKRLKYHKDLLTRGIGGLEMQNRKAEEWASQMQCWSIHLLNCFAVKNRSIDLICTREFLKDLCQMWGGLVNHSSSGGVGLIRLLCYNKVGRTSIAGSKEIIENLCKLSRSSDDWQYMGIDCLVLLLNDPNTRYKIIETATFHLIDLAELRTLRGRSKVGEMITKALLCDFKRRKSIINNSEVETALEEIWALKVERRKREHMTSMEEIEEKRLLVSLIKQEGNHSFWLGKVEAALAKYTSALTLCPMGLRKERAVLFSNRAQCHLLLSDPDAAISDTTRALCLSDPSNSHTKSLWRRSQAYDMKGLAKESLMDCLMFVSGCMKLDTAEHAKIPHYAMRMISKQVDATWLFAAAQSKVMNNDVNKVPQWHEGTTMTSGNKGFMTGLFTILEEPLITKDGNTRRKLERARQRK